MIGYLPDTNVFSRIFKGNLPVTEFVENLEAAIDATIYIECLQGFKIQSRKAYYQKSVRQFSASPDYSENFATGN